MHHVCLIQSISARKAIHIKLCTCSGSSQCQLQFCTKVVSIGWSGCEWLPSECKNAHFQAIPPLAPSAIVLPSQWTGLKSVDRQDHSIIKSCLAGQDTPVIRPHKSVWHEWLKIHSSVLTLCSNLKKFPAQLFYLKVGWFSTLFFYSTIGLKYCDSYLLPPTRWPKN